MRAADLVLWATKIGRISFELVGIIVLLLSPQKGLVLLCGQKSKALVTSI
jgi:hypothetical protein